MHTSAYRIGKKFFDTYCNFGSLKVVEIGSQNYNAKICLKDHRTKNIIDYVGIDFSPGDGVDIVLNNTYSYPFEDNSVDVVVTSSCFEHAEMFWVSFLEAMRILRPSGLLYCNAPSSWMGYHRCPVDCWRFYPDAAKGLETWAKYNKLNSMVMESFIAKPIDEDTSDWVSVFLKDSTFQYLYKDRMIDTLVPYDDYFNGFRFPKTERFPHGWQIPDAHYHQAVKMTFLNSYEDYRY